jgi:hypothetical protein
VLATRRRSTGDPALPRAYALWAVRAGRSVRNLWRAHEFARRSPHLTRQNEKCHENASDCLRLDRCGGDAGDASTCRVLTRLPSRRTMPGVLRSVPAIQRSAAAILWSIALLCSGSAILWSIALLCSASAILQLRLGQLPRCRGRRRRETAACLFSDMIADS